MKTKYILLAVSFFLFATNISISAQSKVYERYCPTNLYSPQQSGGYGYAQDNNKSALATSDTTEIAKNTSPKKIDNSSKDTPHLVADTSKKQHTTSDSISEPKTNYSDTVSLFKVFRKISLFFIYLLFF